MNKQLIQALNMLNKEFNFIEKKINTSDIKNNKNYFKLLARHNFLQKINDFFFKWKTNKEEIEITETLLIEDPNSLYLKNELNKRQNYKNFLEKKIKLYLINNDPHDKHNCLIEIHAGTGGNEATLFVEDLFKMYYKYAEFKRWKTKIININYNNNYKGYKEIIMKIIGKYAYGNLKFESGGHRVQRIPKTESQGRIHTSTCTVAVLPDLPENISIKIDINDLKIDTFRSSGAGGQHVNTTDSAVRITHIPTGIVVECQNERSQHKNKNLALSILKARINKLELEKKNKDLSIKKKELLGSGDRSVRNRTYNYAKGRITDHRINLTIYELSTVLNGKLDLLILPIKNNFNNELLKNNLIKNV